MSERSSEGADVGTWGFGPLDDDTAMEFVEALMAGPSTEAVPKIRTAVETVGNGSGYLDYVEGVQAVAAAVLLAGLPGGPHDDEADIRAWLGTLALQLEPDLAATALRAVRRAHAEGSHLWELMDESGRYDEAWAALRPAMEVLQTAAR